MALAAYSASSDASARAHWQPFMQADQVYLQGNVDSAGPDVARELGAVAAAPIPGLGGDDRYPRLSTGTGATLQEYPNLTVGDAELLSVLHAEAAVTDLQNGAVILLTEESVPASTATLAVLDPDGHVVDSRELPVHDVVTGISYVDLPQAVVSADTARSLRLVIPAARRYLVRLAHDVTEADLARAGSIAGTFPDSWADAALPPQVAGAGFRLVMLGASLLLALSVTGIAVALGEAESRPEQRTLLALGAHPRLRRLVAAARAGSIALLAGVLAVPAGLLPVWGLLASRGSPLVVPVPEVLGAIVALPLLAIVGALLLGRPIPSWSAFRDLSA